jgi:flagella basal body P-ring formation protein FlgA
VAILGMAGAGNSANRPVATLLFGAVRTGRAATLHCVNMPSFRAPPARPAQARPTPPLLGALALWASFSAAAQPLPAATLQAAQSMVRAAAQALAPRGARIEVEPGALDTRLRLAPCARIEPYLPASARAWGAGRVGLRCLEGDTAWNVTLPVTVRVFAPAPVAAAPLPAGTVIEAMHLRLAEVDWAAAPSPVQADADALRGRTLAQPLPAGQPVRTTNLRPRQWFAAGDTVRIVAQGNGFAVSGEGQALSHGIEGQSARVRTESGRIVHGKPLGDRRLELPL